MNNRAIRDLDGNYLPAWVQQMPNKKSRLLYMYGWPPSLWNCEYNNLPPFHPVRKTYGGHITADQQAEWTGIFERSKNHKPGRVLIFSNPTDDAGLALMTIWAKKVSAFRLFDLANWNNNLSDVDPDSPLSLGMFNLTAESSPERLQIARDKIYQNKFRLIFLVISGVYDTDTCSQMEWVFENLRVGQWNTVFHLNGSLNSTSG